MSRLLYCQTVFQSTSPVRGTTADHVAVNLDLVISIHVPRAGDDPLGSMSGTRPGYFNPRPPCGGRHVINLDGAAVVLFQSTSPVRGTTGRDDANQGGACISIHVPRAGDDLAVESVVNRFAISIHVPRAGDDPSASGGANCLHNFNPRPPCGGRRQKSCLLRSGQNFNPRPPCGGRPSAGLNRSRRQVFQSTSPVRGTTPTSASAAPSLCISIHVPRAGDDRSNAKRGCLNHYFNPRPPCGGRRVS